MTKLHPPFPSSPHRPPKYAMYITSAQSSIVTFAAAYSAKKFLDAVIGKDTFKWKSTNELLTSRDISVRCEELETIVEYDYTGAEKEWELPEPHSNDVARLRGEPIKRRVRDEEPTGVVTERTSAKETNKPKAPRPSKDGLTTIAEICEELKVEPRVARGILRANDTPKPDAGWAWPEREAAKIKALIKKEAK